MATNRKSNTKDEQSVTLSDTSGSKGPGGTITLDADVVATIASLCARQIDGIYELGRPRLIDFGGRNRGVDVEVGQKQAAIDLDVVMEYGTDIQKCADELRDRMAQELKKMANRELVEVNIHVADIHLPEEEKEEPKKEKPRVL